MPRGSERRAEQDFFDETFDPFYRISSIIVTATGEGKAWCQAPKIASDHICVPTANAVDA